ncbi:MAG: hypothetical protein ACLTX1_00425 [Hominenteromicrobium sp.]|uniref:hypothetical protein n=1 Tax=Hominenteromicrobium sp. TaxID=3073581 RepID=UPI003994CF7C
MKVVIVNGKGFIGFMLRHMFGIRKLPQDITQNCTYQKGSLRGTVSLLRITL